MIFDPPNLSKRSTKSDSRAKVTKGLFIFSPKHGRMQKFTTFYQAGFENVQNFSIFTCMFSSGWGPYPNLKVLLCEKMHDHLEVISGPWWATSSKSGVSLLVRRSCSAIRRIFNISKVWYDFYLAVPFGHWHLALLQVFFFRLLFENVKKQGGTSVRPLASWEGMLWGKPHISCPQRIFEKKNKFEIWNFLIFDFWGKNCTDRPYFIPGGVQNSF